ncbi:hypothetical protein LTR15_012093 [Elasticomyces elasticus]|nr:hypothetical protein LTR15_012093 [Elasticomyces elasticus]
MSLLSVISLGLLASQASACPGLAKRQSVNQTIVREERDWAYEASYDWGRLRPEYELCQTGTQQSPIPLRLDQGLSRNHIPHFDYPTDVTGDFYNWGFGPAMALSHPEDDWTTLPSMTFDEDGVNETVYLASWHIHAPADHTVAADRSKAEMHFVHVDADGHERVVLAFRVDPGNAPSTFFSNVPEYTTFNDTTQRSIDGINVNQALNEVQMFNDFWTYRGSLTSPPCREGMRWYLARQILFVSDTQMQDILRVCTYSARAEQEVWGHQINQ